MYIYISLSSVNPPRFWFVQIPSTRPQVDCDKNIFLNCAQDHSGPGKVGKYLKFTKGGMDYNGGFSRQHSNIQTSLAGYLKPIGVTDYGLYGCEATDYINADGVKSIKTVSVLCSGKCMFYVLLDGNPRRWLR